MVDQPRRKLAVRFSIAALLFLMLCLGGYLAGYRIGYRQGLSNGEGVVYIRRVYPVGDLVTSPMTKIADFDSLIDLIVTTISPTDWMENGTGDGEIQPFPSNLSLVVSQTKGNHAAIAALLARLRKLQPTSPAASVPPTDNKSPATRAALD